MLLFLIKSLVNAANSLKIGHLYLEMEKYIFQHLHVVKLKIL